MNTAKVYQDSEGNDCSIWQMVRREPDWAANRVQEGEKAIERLADMEERSSTDLQECAEYHRRQVRYLKESLRGRVSHVALVRHSIEKHETWAGAIEMAQAYLRGDLK